MATTWIVTANAGRARFFAQAHPTKPLEEVNDMVNTEVRLRTAETESDRIDQRAAGKSRHNVGAATPSSDYEPVQTPAEHQTERFARDVASFLLQGLQQGRFEQIYLTASPQFLGILRALLDPKLEQLVSVSINKDYTQFTAKELAQKIQEQQQNG